MSLPKVIYVREEPEEKYLTAERKLEDCESGPVAVYTLSHKLTLRRKIQSRLTGSKRWSDG